MGATLANPITLAGGTLGSFSRGTGSGANLTTGDVTVTANSTVKTGDTQVVSRTGSESSLPACCTAAATLAVPRANQVNPNSRAGFRPRRTGDTRLHRHHYGCNRVKFKLQTSVAGPQGQ